MQISNAEWRIMKIIWMEGKQTSRDLIAVCPSALTGREVDHQDL